MFLSTRKMMYFPRRDEKLCGIHKMKEKLVKSYNVENGLN
jgi:hypothetical protein